MKIARWAERILKTAGAACARAVVAAVLLGAPLRGQAPAAEIPAAPWIVLTDVHYDPFARSKVPSPLSVDTNRALLDSLLAELKRTNPNPPVVIIPGDFLAHSFHASAATKTMVELAQRFDRTYPHAQFVIALGNEDSDCGDYEVSLGGPFLRAVATAWAPLVDRRGAAPEFVKTFSRDGGYAASLPVPGLRAVVLNDVYDTVRYRDACGPQENPAATSLDRLARVLASGPKTERTWLVMHVPPGIDAFSTAHLAHRLFVVPFLRTGPRERLLDVINDPANRVALVVAGHTHKFAYRLSNAGRPFDVPILLAPSVSPIFLNSPSFLTLDVGRNGVVGDIVETSYVGNRWQRIGDLTALGVSRFDVPELESLQRRLAAEPNLRERFATLYSGAGVRDITRQNWKIYWCAATQLSAGEFRPCASEGGYSILTGRAVRDIGVLLGAGILLLASGAIVVMRRRHASHDVRGV